MRAHITFQNVSREELPDVVEAFQAVSVTTAHSAQGFYTVTTSWEELTNVQRLEPYRLKIPHALVQPLEALQRWLYPEEKS